jgi:dipeptide/tripeptide permease
MFRGHPRGLAPLFFTEMWERLGFYLIVGILVLYASDAERGGLGMTVKEASAIYGTYLAFVYFTPFLGGIIADRYLGFRRSVLIGGLFFAIGFYLLGVRGMSSFYGGLACLCIGNGFFKPNISAMVGNLYAPGDEKRDAGFNIFYMGINVGAAAANLAGAPIRNQISWQWTFWTAAIGILIGVVILLANWKVLESADRPAGKTADQVPLGELGMKIFLPAAIAGGAGYLIAYLLDVQLVGPTMCAFLAGMVPIFWYLAKLGRTAPEAERPGLAALMPIYIAGGTFFMILHMNGSALTKWADEKTDRDVAILPAIYKQDALPSYYANATPEMARPSRENFLIVDKVTEKLFGTKQFTKSELARLELPTGVSVVDVWQQGTEIRTDENDDHAKALRNRAAFVYPDDMVEIKVEKKELPPGEAAVADRAALIDRVDVTLKDGAHPERKVAFVRDIGQAKPIPLVLATEETVAKIDTARGPETVTLPPGEFVQVVNPEVYQSWNPIFVVIMTPLIVAFFAALVRKGRGISTARKLVLGMVLTGVAMMVMALAGFLTDNGSVKVAGSWLVMTYFVLTIGELCLSPIGLSLVTKLSPKRFVGMMMGGWFCATAFGNKLSGFLGELEQEMAPDSFFLMLVGAIMLVAFYLWRILPRLEATLKRYGA